MEGEGSLGLGLGLGPYRPSTEVENRSCDGIPAPAEIGKCELVDGMDDSQLVGVPVMAATDSVADGKRATAAVDVEVKAEVKLGENSGGKRKRGRPPKGQAKPPASRKNEEEDVCFICFDGGSLVLCDRRGCPKAYHPACIKRDEAFFRSRAKWNCGWHICSSCQKAAHYMCYTCTYSLCKACTKNSDFLCVRENKGFCTTCMRTIMLIENNDQGNKETAQVDFDDKSSWEYLFKVYWVYLKEKLSLTLEELTQAQNPSKAVGTVACNVHHGSNDGKGSMSDSHSGQIEANNSKSRRMKEQPKLSNNGVFLSMDGSISDTGNNAAGSTEWASKELLEFVAHMRNGDKSVLSQFDVQALLLDYIKINNLRDPRQKSRIICDLQLRSLFGKPSVGHIEMLKLLEFHFPAKEDSWKDVVQGSTVDAIVSQVDGNRNGDNLLIMGKDMKRKTHKKGEERGHQTNLDEYAAIDVHNIKLIYLRRNLIESLILDNGTFHDKVVGSIVRIRISCGEQKQDMHRLVQVVGTCKVAVPHKIGEMTADVMLEILNLDKKETISINAISDQEFSENECRRLRQSIKFGLVKRFTVGQVREKAMALQEVRVNDWLETEIMRLSHLRDRASEKGHKKEECVEKLELLKTPEERQRRLHEIPEVHADPNMDPIYDSDEGAGEISNNKQDEYARQRYSGFSKNGMEPFFPQNGDSSNDSGGKVWKNLITSDQSRSMSSSFYLDKEAHSRGEGKDVCGPNALENPENQVDSSGSVVGGWNNQAGLRSGAFSGIGSETSVASLSIVSIPSVDDSETDRLWCYRDPNGKIQGPFCMLQLRKWSTTGYFPPDMKVWSINDDEGDSLLLTDVLNGQFSGVSRLQSDVFLPSQEFKGPSETRLHYSDGTRSSSVNTTRMDSTQSDGDWKCGDEITHSNGNNKIVKADGWGSHSSNWTMAVDNSDEWTGPSSQCWDSLKVKNSCSGNSQLHCPVPSSTFTECPPEISLHQAMGNEGQRWNPSPNHGNWSSHGNLMSQTTGGQSHASKSSSQDHSGQSPVENPQPVNYSSNNSKGKSSDSSEQNFGIDIQNLPSLKLKTSNGDWEGQTAKDQQSVLPNVPVQDLNAQNMPRPTPRPSDDVNERADTSVQIMPDPLPKPGSEDEKVHGIGNKQYASLNFPVQISGPTWSSASSLVAGGGTQLPEISDKWGGCSGTHSKPSVEEWDSRFAPAPSLKPPEPTTDHAVTPTSKCDELTHLSLSHPASNWRAIVTEPIEFSTLAEESVSDLLAEVDAMESQGDLASPTSALSCGEELFQDSKTDCFTSLGGLNPPLDLGKNDALSSSGDIQLPPRPTILGKSEANVLDPVKKSGWQSSTSTEAEVVTKPADVSVIQSVGQSSPQAEMEVETKISDVPVIQSGEQSSMDHEEGEVETKPPNVPVIRSGGKSSASTEVEEETKRSDVPEIPSGGQSSVRTVRTKPSDVPVIESGGQSSSRTENARKRPRKEVEVKVKRTDIPDVKSKAKAGSRSPLAAPSTMNRDVIDTDTAPRAEAKPIDPGSRTMQGNMNDAGSQGSTQGMPDMEWGNGRGNTNTNPSRSSSDGVRGRGSYPKFGGERYMGSKDRAFQSGDSGFGRARQSWSRQSSLGGGGGGSGSYSKPPSKGQRLCKFYLNGYCRKGASCDYLHQR